jgi:hypothetical protein
MSLKWLFCVHAWSWPRFSKEWQINYQVCAKCGKERAYDWEKMRAA